MGTFRSVYKITYSNGESSSYDKYVCFRNLESNQTNNKSIEVLIPKTIEPNTFNYISNYLKEYIKFLNDYKIPVILLDDEIEFENIKHYVVSLDISNLERGEQVLYYLTFIRYIYENGTYSGESDLPNKKMINNFFKLIELFPKESKYKLFALAENTGGCGGHSSTTMLIKKATCVTKVKDFEERLNSAQKNSINFVNSSFNNSTKLLDKVYDIQSFIDNDNIEELKKLL